MQTIRFDDIDRSPARDARACLRDALVAEYADELKVHASLGHGTVFFDGLVYWLGDGLHRMTAGERVGRTEDEFEVLEGGYDEAFEHACRANDKHGGRTSGDDKRARCESYWRRHAHDDPRPSDRKVAFATHVSHTLASEVRRTLEEQQVLGTAETKTGLDGKTYPTRKPDETTWQRLPRETSETSTLPEPESWPDRVAEPDPAEVPGPHRDAGSFYDSDPDDAEETTAEDWQDDAPREPTLGDEQRAFTGFSAKLGKLQGELETFADATLVRREWLDHNRREEFRIRLKNLQETIASARPAALCGYCGGQKCKTCRGTGMLPHSLASSAPKPEAVQ